MRIAGVQFSAKKGDIETNIKNHMKFIKLAVEYNVNLIVFPELSLTGYEPTIADKLAIDTDDKRLVPFQEVSKLNGITIITGAPLKNESDKPYVGALIFKPNKIVEYFKNHLHPGEEDYFSSYRREGCIIEVKNYKIGVAICADINHPSHAKKAAQKGASIYTAGVLMMGGYDDGAERMQRYSKEHSMLTMMANYGSPTGGYIPAGKSAIWDEEGKLLVQAEKEGEALIMGIGEHSRWRGEVIHLH